MKKLGIDKIFYGMIFVLINIPINGVDILPDFIGYILFAIGYEKLKQINGYFERVRKFVWLLILITFINFYRSISLDLTSITETRMIPEILLAVISFILILTNFYNLFYGLRDLALKNGNTAIASESVKRWKQIIILNVLALLLIIIIFVPFLNIIYILALAVFSIYLTIKILKLLRRCGKELDTEASDSPQKS